MKWMKDDKELSKHMADVEKRASEIELESELQRQKKSKPEVSYKLDIDIFTLLVLVVGGHLKASVFNDGLCRTRTDIVECGIIGME